MLSPNTILQNRYRIVRELGRGGMGYVYEAIDQRVNCLVAIKETMTSDNAESRRAFEREAALLANLRHRGLPKVMDYFTEDDGDFLVMEYIPGHDLADLLDSRRGPFSQLEVLRWADDILSLVGYLHSQEPPILHRDIKPSNLKLTKEGELFLLDFGLAKGALGQMPTLVTSRSVRGYTPVYAPLEQILGQGTDPRSDLYSVGATLYHLLTGVPPVDAPARFHATEEELPDPLKPIQDLNASVSSEVASIVISAMSLSRRQRPVSADEMRVALSGLTARIQRRESEERGAADHRQNQERLSEEETRRRHTVFSPAAERGVRDVAPQETLPAPSPAPFTFASEPRQPRDAAREVTDQPRLRRLIVALGLLAVAFVAVFLIWYANLFSRVTANQNQNTTATATATASPSVQPAPTAQPSPTQVPSPTPIVARTINPPNDLLAFAATQEGYAGEVSVKTVDLNLDGVPELIAQYQICGSGGCTTHVLRRRGTGFDDIGAGLGEYLMVPLDRSSIEAGPTMMNGYLDIKYGRQYFTFDGRHYQCARGC